MKNNALIIALVLVALVLSSCGFHLRKNVLKLDLQYPILLLPTSGSHTLHEALHRALRLASIEVVQVPPPGSPILPKLVVVSQQLTQQPLVYGQDGELRRERIKM